LEKPAKSKDRERVLNCQELTKVLATPRASGDYGEILQLLILTMQRESQIAAATCGPTRLSTRTD
jgi:hypothetical protein